MKCCVYTNDKIFINSPPRHMSTPVRGVVPLPSGVTVIVSQQAVAGHGRGQGRARDRRRPAAGMGTGAEEEMGTERGGKKNQFPC